MSKIVIGSPANRFRPEQIKFVAWHEAPDSAKLELRRWVGGLLPWRDGEYGGGPFGALRWLDQKIALSSPGGLFQTFIGLLEDEVVWTGSVVEDDRGVKARLASNGLNVDGFLGLFNTRTALRGRGIGWAGVNHVNNHVQLESNRSQRSLAIALFTENDAAERHYRSLGFVYLKKMFVPSFSLFERVYLKKYASGITHRVQ